MKAKKEILLAIEASKQELLLAVSNMAEKKASRRKKSFGSPLQEHFEALSVMLDNTVPPNRFKVMTIVAPLADALEKEDRVADGLFDLLPPTARKSIIMLFLFHLLNATDEEKPKDDVPLDVENGQDRNPYNNKPVAKLDRGF